MASGKLKKYGRLIPLSTVQRGNMLVFSEPRRCKTDNNNRTEYLWYCSRVRHLDYSSIVMKPYIKIKISWLWALDPSSCDLVFLNHLKANYPMYI